MKIFITGHNGLVGSALLRASRQRGYSDVVTAARSQLDLRNRQDVFAFFEANRPEWVFLAAAKVGGIVANFTLPADFLLDNLRIQNNVIEASHAFDVQKLLFLGSSCIYPKHCPQPIKEEYLLSSALEPTNEAYSLAKIAGLKLCDAFNRQYKTDYLCVMPANLYGPGDNFHPEHAHALPMLLARMHEAKVSGEPECVVWGSGTPRREFLHVDDLSRACFHLMEEHTAAEIGPHVNIGVGSDLSIIELATLIKEVVDYSGRLVLDSSKPDGTPQKLLDISRITQTGWKPEISLETGLQDTYEAFLSSNEIRR